MTKLIRPLFYHWKGKSDQDWIAQRMKVIPELLRREVSDRYETLYIQNDGGTGRKDANEYLNGIASKYRVEQKPRNASGREIKLKTKPVERPNPKRMPLSKAQENFISDKVKDRKFNSSNGLWSKDI